MRTLKFLLQKEFRQIFRNKTILRMIIGLPIIQLIVLPLAADFEFKNINISVIDHDRSTYSRRLTDKIIASGYFKLNDYSDSYRESFKEFERDNADLIIEIPQNFETDLIREDNSTLLIAVNAINGTKAIVGNTYLNQIIGKFNSELRQELGATSRFSEVATIEVESINWYNPYLNYQFFMVPGILVLLVTMVGAYMCALNIVKEKEVGTIEQINVTPIKKVHFILGKLIPFWLIGIFVFTLGLFGVARLVYNIVPLGSIGLLYAFLGIYLIALLGIGLLISTYSENQQQAMSVAFFFVMIFILMSGLFTSIDSMPQWAQWIAAFNPVTYFIDVVRLVILKGSGFRDIQTQFAVMTGMAIFFNTWAILNYSKTN
jgi:ABC-2 type transport system permease protein